jgi:AbrB family looped-hinge helix DNA binding protein
MVDQTVTVSRSGQVTIPKEILDQLGISVPGKVRFVLDEERKVEIEKIPRPSELKGMGTGWSDEQFPRTGRLRAEREYERDRYERLLENHE